MKRFLSGIVLFITLTSFTVGKNDIYPLMRNESFRKGEVLHFKMTYGIFTVGRGSAEIQPQYYRLNNRDCFKVDIRAKTVGMIDWVTDINDQWGAYIDTAALVPHMFYRKIREGNYKKDEQTYFDHLGKKIQVITADKKTGKWKEPKVYDAPAQVRDMVAGFLYLRTIDMSRIQAGDTVVVAGFFEDEFYKLKIVFKGREVVRTKAGKIRCLAFRPLMPKNSLFDGEDSIMAYFSDDKNRIPIKIDAKMFIGSAGVELTDYANLRNPLNKVK